MFTICWKQILFLFFLELLLIGIFLANKISHNEDLNQTRIQLSNFVQVPIRLLFFMIKFFVEAA